LFSLAKACADSTAFGLLFWLPKYFDSKHLSDYSGALTITFDVAYFVGGLAQGIMSDVFRKRAIVLCPAFYLNAIFMAIILFFLDD
jgi:hypothetical protein